MFSSSSSQSSSLLSGPRFSPPGPFLADQPAAIVELIYQFLDVTPEFHRFSLTSHYIHSISLSSISWKNSRFGCCVMNRNDFIPFRMQLNHIRSLDIEIWPDKSVSCRHSLSLCLLLNLCTLDFSHCCPLLESLELSEKLKVDDQDFLQAWSPFIVGLSKCRHLKRLKLDDWVRPLSGLESLNQLDELVIWFHEADPLNQAWVNNAVNALQNLKKVNVLPIDCETMETLADMPDLLELDISFAVQHSDIDEFALGLPNLKSVKKLRCNQIEILTSPELSEMPALECLYYDIAPGSKELCFALPCIPTLRRLEIELQPNKKTFNWHRIIRFVRDNPQLESIQLGAGMGTAEIEHLDFHCLIVLLKKLPNLTNLQLDHRFLVNAPFRSAYSAHVTERGRIRNRLDFMHALVDLNEPIQPIGRGVKRPFGTSGLDQEANRVSKVKLEPEE